MVKIVATSDLHGELPSIPACDLLLIAGDICPGGSIYLQEKWLGGAFRHWLNALPAKEVVIIAGNHDKVFERGQMPEGLRCHYLQDSAVELFGLMIYGTPWQLPFWGAFNLPEAELEKKYRLIPPKTDILISHSPPYCIADAVERLDGVEHTGSRSLRQKVFEIKPKLFLCGHIHNAFGIYKIEGIVFANVSLLDDELRAVHPPVEFCL
jgi:Icc-related predicted phosphoesterase